MTAPNMKEVVERVEAKARRLEDLAKAHGRTKEAQERAQAAADLRAVLAYVGECREAMEPDVMARLARAFGKPVRRLSVPGGDKYGYPVEVEFVNGAVVRVMGETPAEAWAKLWARARQLEGGGG